MGKGHTSGSRSDLFGGPALHLPSQSPGKPLRCTEVELGTVGLGQAQIPIQVHEVREAGDLILEAAAREDKVLKGGRVSRIQAAGIAGAERF